MSRTLLPFAGSKTTETVRRAPPGAPLSRTVQVAFLPAFTVRLAGPTLRVLRTVRTTARSGSGSVGVGEALGVGDVLGAGVSRVQIASVFWSKELKTSSLVPSPFRSATTAPPA